MNSMAQTGLSATSGLCASPLAMKQREQRRRLANVRTRIGFTSRLVRLPDRFTRHRNTAPQRHQPSASDPVRCMSGLGHETACLARSLVSLTYSSISLAYFVLYPKEELWASLRQRPKCTGRPDDVRKSRGHLNGNGEVLTRQGLRP